MMIARSQAALRAALLLLAAITVPARGRGDTGRHTAHSQLAPAAAGRQQQARSRGASFHGTAAGPGPAQAAHSQMSRSRDRNRDALTAAETSATAAAHAHNHSCPFRTGNYRGDCTWGPVPGAVQTIYQGGVPHTDRHGAPLTDYDPARSFLPTVLYMALAGPPLAARAPPPSQQLARSSLMRPGAWQLYGWIAHTRENHTTPIVYYVAVQCRRATVHARWPPKIKSVEPKRAMATSRTSSPDSAPGCTRAPRMHLFAWRRHVERHGHAARAGRGRQPLAGLCRRGAVQHGAPMGGDYARRGAAGGGQAQHPGHLPHG